LLEALEASLLGAEYRVATWLPKNGRTLARAVFDADRALVFASDSLDSAQLASAIGSGQAASTRPGAQPIYIETLSPPQRLFVFGAGDDARPVVTMAALLGWSVTVIDGRPQLARPERFPQAERVIAASVATAQFTTADAAVLMTHSYDQDRAVLTALLASGSNGQPSAGPGYIGLLGATHRSSLLISESAATLGATVADCCQRVWAPVGLDLGGDGAEAIALAVIAEIQAWRQGKLGASRRLTPEAVARQIQKDGASRYLQAQCAIGS
jgi:xanthine dehydrogenase accessory factor